MCAVLDHERFCLIHIRLTNEVSKDSHHIVHMAIFTWQRGEMLCLLQEFGCQKGVQYHTGRELLIFQMQQNITIYFIFKHSSNSVEESIYFLMIGSVAGIIVLSISLQFSFQRINLPSQISTVTSGRVGCLSSEQR